MKTPKKQGANVGPRLPGLEGFGGWGDAAPAAPSVPVAPAPRPAEAREVQAKREPVVVPSAAYGAATGRGAGFALEALAKPLDVVPIVAPEDAGWVRELLAFPVALFPKLGKPATSLHAVTASGRAFVVTSSRAEYARARERRVPVFVGGELLAFAGAARNDRMSSADFERFVERKSAAGDWRLTDEIAFAGMWGAREELKDSIERCFERIGATLLRVTVDE
jgi:hypothetical protein